MKLKKKHYRLWKGWVKHYAELFGLTDYAIHTTHYWDPKDKVYGRSRNNVAGSISILSLNMEMPQGTEQEQDVETRLRTNALHGLAHTLLTRLTAESHERFTTEERLHTEEHALIRRLEHAISRAEGWAPYL